MGYREKDGVIPLRWADDGGDSGGIVKPELHLRSQKS
jgi:hypothetical protein